ncbi:6847_t:CDS:10 [Ambispora leptoticha]|uniref:6847_t:CDS:1 n=1 Tax=Ambispora leptoticha TaxID=144679 RepID=A0A9N8ZTN8_9GLOM|nr:6847_t:CDS:10 [Ambispora leptoticha]
MIGRALQLLFSPVTNLFGPYFSRFTDAATSQKTQRVAVKSIFFGVVAFILVSIASFSYLGFYMLYVPKISHVKPVHLQYQKAAFPTALVNFTSGYNFLTADQAYDVTIDLHVPNSERNVKLGNFMIFLELNSAKKNNETVHRSSRSTILHKQSELLRVMSTIWRLPPLLLGWTKEDQMLHVKMFENMIEDLDRPISHAYVTIDEPLLETYEVKIRLDAHFKGLRYFMYYHPYITGSTFTAIFLFWEFLFCIVAWKMLVSWWQTNFPETLKNRPKNTGKRNNGNNGDNDSQNGDAATIDEEGLGGGWETIKREDGSGTSEDKENASEAESESDVPRVASNVATRPNIPTSPETTESYTTEDDDQGVLSAHSQDDIGGSRIPETDGDSIDYDDGQGSVTPTTRKRPIIGTSTSRVPTTGSHLYNRRVPGAGVSGGGDSDTNVGNNTG